MALDARCISLEDGGNLLIEPKRANRAPTIPILATPERSYASSIAKIASGLTALSLRLLTTVGIVFTAIRAGGAMCTKLTQCLWLVTDTIAQWHALSRECAFQLRGPCVSSKNTANFNRLFL